MSQAIQRSLGEVPTFGTLEEKQNQVGMAGVHLLIAGPESASLDEGSRCRPVVENSVQIAAWKLHTFASFPKALEGSQGS